jgi:hypothetical protein
LSRGRFRPAFDEPREGDEQLFHAYLKLANGRTMKDRLGGMKDCIGILLKRQKRTNERTLSDE